MKHLPTTVLLDLAEDYLAISKLNSIPARKDGAMLKLAQIDEELLSRAPEGEFVTMLGEDSNPVGFEPYTREDNEYLALYVTYDENSP